VLRDHKVHLVLLVQRDHKVPRDLLDLQEPPVRKEQRDHKVVQEALV
jgi:hypothetical protein